MSRVGKLPIQIPSGVTITVDNSLVTVAGSKGTLSQELFDGITITQEGTLATVARRDESDEQKAKHGLMRALLNNMIVGVSKGFTKELEINGVGYRAQPQGTDLKLNLGFSHDVIYKVPSGVQATVNQNIITVAGISKQQVGQVAAEIRALKKPEPYKGKGIKYVGERILRKAGKSGKDK